jgi:hypothetical protein
MCNPLADIFIDKPRHDHATSHNYVSRPRQQLIVKCYPISAGAVRTYRTFVH